MTPEPLPPTQWDFASRSWPDDDLVGVGADLEPATIVDAYRTGLFPMPIGPEGAIGWWSPLRRGVLSVDDFHVSRSLHRSRRRMSITVDQDFEAVIDACADPRRPGAWIDAAIRGAYVRLHRLGWAHSIEARDAEGTLVGGLYGLAIGGLFAGESMFHHATDASKVALLALVELLDDAYGPMRLVDVQWRTNHLATLGIREIPRAAYLSLLPDLAALPEPRWWR